MIGIKESRTMASTTGAAAAPLCAVLLFLFMMGGAQGAGTTAVGFYSASCPRAEAIIRATVQARFKSDQTITPALLRMFFHDCFVSGCDASILLDSTSGNKAEKEASPNLTVRGFDLIDAVKEALEAECPGIVSCADIIAVATRDSLVLSGGPNYDVPCGRKDSLTSQMSDADALPSPSATVDEVIVAFAEKGLTLTSMVALLGAHTMGVTHCSFFNDRIFSFQGSGAPDPTMNATLVKKMANVCPNPFTSETAADPIVALDQGTVNVFDSSYFSQLLAGDGILQIDQELAEDARTLQLVNKFRDSSQFFSEFVRSIVLLGNLNVKTAAQGEVRRSCHKVNGPNTASPPPKPSSPPPKAAPPPPPPKPASPRPPKKSPPARPRKPKTPRKPKSPRPPPRTPPLPGKPKSSPPSRHPKPKTPSPKTTFPVSETTSPPPKPKPQKPKSPSPETTSPAPKPQSPKPKSPSPKKTSPSRKPKSPRHKPRSRKPKSSQPKKNRQHKSSHSAVATSQLSTHGNNRHRHSHHRHSHHRGRKH